MKRLLKLPKKWRNLIGSVVALAGVLGTAFVGGDASLILTLPFVGFFVWLCPELWSGE